MKKMLVVLALVVAACGGTAGASGPPEINYGRDICIECGMIIDDPRFAAGYRLSDGTEKTFDDLGGLIIQGREFDELQSAEVWVSDFEDKVLIAAADAFYVPTMGVNSPMGHGILAFSEESRAVAVATDLGGEVIGWEVVTELPVVEGLVGHHHEMDESMDHDE